LKKGSAGILVDDAGQSLVEVALALPLLLVLLLGIADGARAYRVAAMVANGAREGANFAARTGTASVAQVTQRACDSTALVEFGNPCPGLTVTCTSQNGDAIVEVSYDFALITTSLADAAFRVNPITIRAAAKFPLMTVGTPCAN